MSTTYTVMGAVVFWSFTVSVRAADIHQRVEQFALPVLYDFGDVSHDDARAVRGNELLTRQIDGLFSQLAGRFCLPRQSPGSVPQEDVGYRDNKSKPNYRISPFARLIASGLIYILAFYVQGAAHRNASAGRKLHGNALTCCSIGLVCVACISLPGDWWNWLLGKML